MRERAKELLREVVKTFPNGRTVGWSISRIMLQLRHEGLSVKRSELVKLASKLDGLPDTRSKKLLLMKTSTAPCIWYDEDKQGWYKGLKTRRKLI